VITTLDGPGWRYPISSPNSSPQSRSGGGSAPTTGERGTPPKRPRRLSGGVSMTWGSTRSSRSTSRTTSRRAGSWIASDSGRE